MTPDDVQVRPNSDCAKVFPSMTAGLCLTLLRTPGEEDAWTVAHHSGTRLLVQNTARRSGTPPGMLPSSAPTRPDPR